MRTTYVFLPVKGSLVTADEAKIIGVALLDLQRRHPHGFTTADLLALARHRTSSLHKVFLRHRARMARGLDGSVITYLRKSVDVMEVRVEDDGERIEGPALPAARVFEIGTENGSRHEEQVYLASQVRSREELLAAEEERFKARLRTMVSDFLGFSGGDLDRVRNACADILAEYAAPPSIREDTGPAAASLT